MLLLKNVTDYRRPIDAACGGGVGKNAYAGVFLSWANFPCWSQIC